ncbi:MAG TPA: sigma-54 dependent transcriptional regulator [Polyangiaceae bacterium]|nr:sigma-54 dependent transcriptional regulator [Polyangiaceae bacterium]
MILRPCILFLPDASERMRAELDNLGISTVSASQGEQAHEVDLILIEPKQLGRDVALLRREFEDSHPGVPVVVMGDAGLESAIAAMRAGAADYVEATTTAAELASITKRLISERAIVHSLSGSNHGSDHGSELIGNSQKARELRERVSQLANSDVTVLISGETGSGKELVANLLHRNGSGKAGPFVVVGCSTIPASLAESELFGHVKGAFSGALTAHLGLVRAAHGGTLFLDDVGSLSLDLQAKLLRVLQQRSVRPIGATQEVPTDFRLLASTTVPLLDLVKRGVFREDLYYRLAVVEIAVPSLRDREHDALLLAELFLQEASAHLGKTVRSLSTAAARALLAYRWPGNVRELKNGIEYAVTVAAFDHLSESDLPEAIHARRSSSGEVRADDPRWSAVERQHIEAVLRSVDGNRARAARLLGIDRRTLHRKLDRLSIDVPPRSRPSVLPPDNSSK